MNLHQITSAIKTSNGEVIALGPTSFGFVVRAIVNNHSCRIIRPKEDPKTQIIPQERGCETHVITDDQSLQTWLRSLAPQSVQEAL
ncbi:hypothetical protein GCM10028809_42510 [Spirosoma gilvum]